MNRLYLLLAALLVNFLIVPAQTVTVTYNYDAAKEAAFKSMIDAKQKLGGNINFLSTQAADKASQALLDRADVDSLNLIDRQSAVDIAYQQEKDRITKAQEIFQANINFILAYGGSIEDKKQWQTIYNSITFALNEVRKAYLPTSKRKVQYEKITDDYIKQNNTLVAYLKNKQSQRQVQTLLNTEGSTLRAIDKSKAISDAKKRWETASVKK